MSSIVEKLRADGRCAEVLAGLLGLDEEPAPDVPVRCPHHERHPNGDARPSFVLNADLAGGSCKSPACGFSAGLLGLAADRLSLPNERAAAEELERRYGGTNGRDATTPKGRNRDRWPDLDRQAWTAG